MSPDDKIALDIVLVPPENILETSIRFNRYLLISGNRGIVLGKKSCIPHISLLMGTAKKDKIKEIKKVFKQISKSYSSLKLKIEEVYSKESSFGRIVTGFKIHKTRKLNSLHEKLMKKLSRYLSHKSSSGAFHSSPSVDKLTLHWIDNYIKSKCMKNYFPHITLGVGKIDNKIAPVTFTASKLALCHLGNHCTCRKVLMMNHLSHK